MKKNTICCLFNLGPLYRYPIYSMMDKTFDCDFYFGDTTFTKIKTFKYEALDGYKGLLKFSRFGPIYRLKGALRAALNPNYRSILTIGDPWCIDIWLILLISKFCGKKTIVWTHGIHSKFTSKFTKILFKLFFKLPNKILLYGDYSRNYMINMGYNSDTLDCIYNSLDYDTQLISRNKYKEPTDIYKKHFGNNHPNLFYIGRLQSRKRLDLVIEAMHILKGRGIFLNFTMVGERTDALNIDELIDKYNLSSSVWEYGKLFDEDKKAELMASADICISPGNIGLTAMDSLMFGLPVITNDNFEKQMPEFEAIIDGVNGTFFKDNDSTDLADKIDSWLQYAKMTGRSIISSACYKPIDERYNPHYQIDVLKKVLL